MKRLLMTAALGIALGLMPSGAIAADTIVTGPVDRAGFQALIDAANPGDTISCLGGVYDFGSPGWVYLDKRLTIEAADPSDPPVLRGDGSIYTSFFSGNNGFTQRANSLIEGLTIQGLRFEDFDRALAFPWTFDATQPGCPQFPGAGLENLKVLDNTVHNSRRFIQIFNGPAEHFIVKGNDVELIGGDVGILVAGGALGCLADGTMFDGVRPDHGMIQGNHVRGDFFAAFYIDGVERLSVKENLVEGGFVGIAFWDNRALYFSDDGPIRLGSVKENVIDGALFGIIAEGPTTITGAQIKDNQISGGLLGVLLDLGANGFEVKFNDFSGVGLAEVYLGLDEDNLIPDGCGAGIDSDDFACAPETYGNVVKVYEGDRVFDFGVDNEVKIGD